MKKNYLMLMLSFGEGSFANNIAVKDLEIVR